MKTYVLHRWFVVQHLLFPRDSLLPRGVIQFLKFS